MRWMAWRDGSWLRRWRGIVGIVFVVFEVGLDVLGRHDFDGVTHGTEFSCPLVTGATGFYAYGAGGQFFEVLVHLGAFELSAYYGCFFPIYSVYLKYVFCQVQTDSGNIHFGCLLCCLIV